MTLTTARQRGFGSAITIAALLEEREVGYRAAVLQASVRGQSIYARLGFVRVRSVSRVQTPLIGLRRSGFALAASAIPEREDKPEQREKEGQKRRHDNGCGQAEKQVADHEDDPDHGRHQED